MNYPLTFSAEVKNALENKLPIVALESTIISHGMPYPQNKNVAKKVEHIIRENGAVPATIAIIDGEIHIGLDDYLLEKLASSTEVIKCSRRDLPFVISQKKNGSTTVSATMILAEMAGIFVFATGGIGGVHRDAENTWDVSADLIELSQTNVAVVSAGAKAILDLPKTLEYLETHGVPVIGFQTDEFPAFYTQKSGIKLALRLDNEIEIAHFIHAKWKMNLRGGVVVANPIPASFSLEEGVVEQAIQIAIKQATALKISGKELTPFLLKKINEVTEGNSQKANEQLVLNNAKIASNIAVEFSKLK